MVVEKAKSLINTADTHGMTPVHIAAQNKHFSLCEALIDCKGDPNSVNNKVRRRKKMLVIKKIKKT